MRSPRLLVTAAIVAVVLAGCATPTPSEPHTPPSPPASAAPSAEPAQQRETGMTRPAGVFGGTCGELFTDAELQSVMGEPLTIRPNHFNDLWGGGGVIDQSGGLMCRWGGDSSVIIAVVLLDGTLDKDLVELECTEGGSHDVFSTVCDLVETSNGILLSAMVSAETPATTVAVQRDALRALFVERSAEQPATLVPIPAVGSWVLPPDCEAVVAGADLSGVPGLGAGATGAEGPGYGKNGPQAEFAIAPTWSPPSCSILGESEGVYVYFVPIGGYRWKESEIAGRSDAAPLTLDGVDAAYAVPSPWEDTTIVYAFSGPNMLVFTVKYTKNAAGIATALIASLDSTAVK